MSLRSASLALIGCLGLGGCLACGDPRPPDPVESFDPAFDLQVVALDAAAPYLELDGTPSSIFLGSGWSPPQRADARPEKRKRRWFERESKRRDRSTRWAIDGESVLWAELPEAPLDFWAELHAYSHESLPPQRLTIEIDGREVATAPVATDWHALRLPLDDVGAGWKTLTLRFAWAAKPSEVAGRHDERRLTAEFRALALVPRDVEDPRAFRQASELDPSRRELVLPPGGRVAWPLPAPARATIAFGPGRGCPACRVRVRWHPPGGPARLLYETSGDEAHGVEAALEGRGLGRLSVEVVPPAPGERVRPLEIPLPEGFFAVTPGSAAPARPHVVVHLVDTLRRDALGVYGGRAPTPHIDAFARDAVVYRDVWSPSSWTLPAVVSVLTGLYPSRHRVSFGRPTLDPGATPTLAAHLRARGYASVGISQSFVAGPKFGIDADFDAFYLSNRLNGWALRAGDVRGLLARWLQHHWDGETPFFAYLHTVDPHAPYAPTARDLALVAADLEPLERDAVPHKFVREGWHEDVDKVAALRAHYEAQVVHADREFGRLVAFLRATGLYDRSLVALTSDHGEEFAEHGGLDHGRAFYEEMLQVPLIVRFPGGDAAGVAIEAPVETLDLTATILALADPGATFDLDGDPLPTREPASDALAPYAEVKTSASAQLAAVQYRSTRFGNVKCIENLSGVDQFHRPAPRFEAYDLAADPGEREPLEEAHPGAARCRDRLAARAGENGTAARFRLEENVDDATREKLRALGYVAD